MPLAFETRRGPWSPSPLDGEANVHERTHEGRRALTAGPALLHDSLLNKGTASTLAERRACRLIGLLPPHVHSLEEQVARVLDNYRRKPTDLERYVHLMSLQDRKRDALLPGGDRPPGFG